MFTHESRRSYTICSPTRGVVWSPNGSPQVGYCCQHGSPNVMFARNYAPPPPPGKAYNLSTTGSSNTGITSDEDEESSEGSRSVGPMVESTELSVAPRACPVSEPDSSDSPSSPDSSDLDREILELQTRVYKHRWREEARSVYQRLLRSEYERRKDVAALGILAPHRKAACHPPSATTAYTPSEEEEEEEFSEVERKQRGTQAARKGMKGQKARGGGRAHRPSLPCAHPTEWRDPVAPSPEAVEKAGRAIHVRGWAGSDEEEEEEDDLPTTESWCTREVDRDFERLWEGKDQAMEGQVVHEDRSTAADEDEGEWDLSLELEDSDNPPSPSPRDAAQGPQEEFQKDPPKAKRRGSDPPPVPHPPARSPRSLPKGKAQGSPASTQFRQDLRATDIAEYRKHNGRLPARKTIAPKTGGPTGPKGRGATPSAPHTKGGGPRNQQQQPGAARGGPGGGKRRRGSVNATVAPVRGKDGSRHREAIRGAKEMAPSEGTTPTPEPPPLDRHPTHQERSSPPGLAPPVRLSPAGGTTASEATPATTPATLPWHTPPSSVVPSPSQPLGMVALEERVRCLEAQLAQALELNTRQNANAATNATATATAGDPAPTSPRTAAGKIQSSEPLPGSALQENDAWVLTGGQPLPATKTPRTQSLTEAPTGSTKTWQDNFILRTESEVLLEGKQTAPRAPPTPTLALTKPGIEHTDLGQLGGQQPNLGSPTSNPSSAANSSDNNSNSGKEKGDTVTYTSNNIQAKLAAGMAKAPSATIIPLEGGQSSPLSGILRNAQGGGSAASAAAMGTAALPPTPSVGSTAGLTPATATAAPRQHPPPVAVALGGASAKSVGSTPPAQPPMTFSGYAWSSNDCIMSPSSGGTGGREYSFKQCPSVDAPPLTTGNSTHSIDAPPMKAPVRPTPALPHPLTSMGTAASTPTTSSASNSGNFSASGVNTAAIAINSSDHAEGGVARREEGPKLAVDATAAACPQPPSLPGDAPAPPQPQLQPPPPPPPAPAGHPTPVGTGDYRAGAQGVGVGVGAGEVPGSTNSSVGAAPHSPPHVDASLPYYRGANVECTAPPAEEAASKPLQRPPSPPSLVDDESEWMDQELRRLEGLKGSLDSPKEASPPAPSSQPEPPPPQPPKPPQVKKPASSRDKENITEEWVDNLPAPAGLGLMYHPPAPPPRNGGQPRARSKAKAKANPKPGGSGGEIVEDRGREIEEIKKKIAAIEGRRK